MLDPPVVEVERDSVHSPIGKTVELRCKAHGQPKPTQTWYRNVGERLLPVRGHGYDIMDNKHPNEPSILTIQSVLEKDYGVYTCFSRNTFNQNGSASIEVTGMFIDVYAEIPREFIN